MPKRKSKLVMCERCDTTAAVIVHEHNYYCADCALFEMGIPFKIVRNLHNNNYVHEQ